jgi:hypothetical protein
MQTEEELYEQRFKELFFDQIGIVKLKINFDNSYIKYFYTKDDKYLGHYNSKNRVFWLSYQNVCSKFKSEFEVNDQEFNRLSKVILEEAYNLKVITTPPRSIPLRVYWKKLTDNVEREVMDITTTKSDSIFKNYWKKIITNI